jgi:hypothetical protein
MTKESDAGASAPAKKKWRWWQIALAVFVGLIVIGKLAPAPRDSEKPKAQDEKAAAATTPASADEDGSSKSKWAYSDYKDEMRGTETRMARLTSENSIDLEFPYGEQSGVLTVQRDPKAGLDVVLSVEKGQILCDSFTENYLSAKFDGGPIQNYKCSGASDGSSNYGFVKGPNSFLKKLKASKRVVIEAEFFQRGRQQFVFETAGLDWK